MTEDMREALGYDEFGNNPRLLHPSDERIISKGEVRRVNGDMLCQKCHMPVRLHPKVQGALWVTRSCEGLVKL